jgi:Protein of unknown function (DUF3592)
VNFFQMVFAPSSKNDGKSWNPLWKLVPFLVFLVFFFGFRTADQNDAASNQQTSLGTIGGCEHRGRGNENYCHYFFPVGDERYTGVNQAGPELESGQTVVVYYDSEDPRVNALEDFTEKSHESRGFFYIFLSVLVAVVAVLLWDRAFYRKKTSVQLTP